MNYRSLFVLPVLSLSVALFGCVASPEDPADDEADLGEAQGALCTDVTADFSAQLIMGDVAGTVYSVSPNTSYGSFQCLHRYVVDALSVHNKPNLAAYADWADAPLTTSAACTAASVTETIYGRNFLTGVYGTIVSHTVNGTWNGSSCSFATGTLVNSSVNGQVRVAASAQSGGVYKKVSATISAHY